MSGPRRLQLSRRAGARLPADAVVVARPSRWGNPFNWRDALSEFGGSPAEAKAWAVQAFREQVVDGMPSAGTPEWLDYLHGVRCHVFAHVHELRGRDLACWCAPDQPCHADVLLELANGSRPSVPFECLGEGVNA